ncbi:MAG: cation transporter [Alphaproteobacteria bacterium]|nr:MAG: cation transporter [Alphaproteobacteria bacterium]
MAHVHNHHRTGNRRRIAGALVLTFVFMLAEVAGGLWSGSLALLADAGHMLADVGALGLAWVGFRLADRPSDARRSYGYERFEVLAAFVNGLALVAVALWIVVEGVGRLADPVAILPGPMLGVAIGGLVINIMAFRILHGGDRTNLNLRAALFHVAGDMLGSVAAIAAAATIMVTGWLAIDPILSFLVAALVLWGAIDLVRRSGHILLEGVPQALNAAQIRDHLMSTLPELSDVHHIHIWALTESRPLVTLHAVIAQGDDPNRVVERVKTALEQEFAIGHATVQVEIGACADS